MVYHSPLHTATYAPNYTRPCRRPPLRQRHLTDGRHRVVAGAALRRRRRGDDRRFVGGDDRPETGPSPGAGSADWLAARVDPGGQRQPTGPEPEPPDLEPRQAEASNATPTFPSRPAGTAKAFREMEGEFLEPDRATGARSSDLRRCDDVV